jgi:cytochrome c oxidase subunit 4
MQGHVTSTRTYLTIFGLLMLLTFLTVFVRLGLHIESFTIAISIALVKATLVILYFMHVKYSPILSKAAVITSVLFLFILLIMVSMDYVSRDWQPKPTPWEQHQVLDN